jgi:exopolysaccharide biosynthesis protein
VASHRLATSSCRRFEVRRNPRTLAGVTGDGRLLLVVVEGRRPGYGVGASFAESARVLRALRAADGVNLDGGGSTSLTVGSSLVNRRSDATGERPIGDALLLRRLSVAAASLP